VNSAGIGTCKTQSSEAMETLHSNELRNLLLIGKTEGNKAESH
jgi:hypothetical protein